MNLKEQKDRKTPGMQGFFRTEAINEIWDFLNKEGNDRRLSTPGRLEYSYESNSYVRLCSVRLGNDGKR
ncbi:unnamed protein product [Allacma fusca]|uniref:Uncharacterized protein n=1 Tax=Allacma fusca TaxID=39272 RepID=A0A8J2L9E5_9HEXA|nr:unnamed protein product [Allacma fusca]